jgi:tRNA(fMet)-specific endonuclease VapC
VALILDTSALIAWERLDAIGQSPALPDEEVLLLPAVVWAEALVGVRLANTAQRAAHRRAQLEAFRRTLDIIPFTADIAEHYADIAAELSRAGTPIPQNDIAVAATARSLGVDVLVGPGDEVHFKKVSGLDVRVLTSA